MKNYVLELQRRHMVDGFVFEKSGVESVEFCKQMGWEVKDYLGLGIRTSVFKFNRDEVMGSKSLKNIFSDKIYYRCPNFYEDYKDVLDDSLGRVPNAEEQLKFQEENGLSLWNNILGYIREWDYEKKIVPVRSINFSRHLLFTKEILLENKDSITLEKDGITLTIKYQEFYASPLEVSKDHRNFTIGLCDGSTFTFLDYNQYVREDLHPKEHKAFLANVWKAMDLLKERIKEAYV